MIISRFISKEIIVNICWVSLVLFGLVLFSRFNIFLSQAEVGKISADSIFIALLLFSPELLNIIFPLSVFLAVGFVLTPIFKSHSTVLESGSYSPTRLIWDQKLLIAGIFGVSIFLSTFLSPYFTAKGQQLVDQDNTFAAKISNPEGLVALNPNTFNAFGIKNEQDYSDLIFFNSQELKTFLFGASGSVSSDEEGSKLLLSDGFLYDDTNKAISRFENAVIPLEEPTISEYVPTLDLYGSSDLESIRVLLQRLTIPLFCLISLLFSMSFSAYSSFWGRERTYFILTMLNILYLVLTIAPFESNAKNISQLLVNFFSIHCIVAAVTVSLYFKQTKKLLGYEGL